MGSYKNNIYQGGYSSIDPTKSPHYTGASVSPSSIGLATDPRTADQVKTATSKLNTGSKSVEVGSPSADIFESIPNQQLEELRRLGKLTNADISVHLPVLEPSGATEQGWSEANREAVERQMLNGVQRAQRVNPNGNTQITLHSSAGLPGEIPRKGDKEADQIPVINTESGKINVLPLMERHFPGKEKGKGADEEIRHINNEQWEKQLSQISHYANIASQSIKHYGKYFGELKEKKGYNLSGDERMVKAEYKRGEDLLSDSYRQLKELFDSAMRNTPKESKDYREINNFLKDNESKIKEVENSNTESIQQTVLKSQIVDEGLDKLRNIQEKPQIYKKMGDFMMDQSAKTFGNLAFKSYKKYKKNAPIIGIENPPAGGAFSTGKELKKMVGKAREHFIQMAVKEKNISRKKAEKIAEKQIGVTWDVGHINMMKKYGWTDEDLKKDSKEIAPLTKHVHFSDNFGHAHTELPMGMGNVPIKKMMEELEKEGYSGKEIVEAGNWAQHFMQGGASNDAFQPTLEGMGSPTYSMDMGPYWNQNAAHLQNYSTGYGMMLPSVNYESLGAGFSQLPMELGGPQQRNRGNRMSGTPME